MRSLVLSVVVLAAAGCVVDIRSTPLGKPCPCPSGYTCDSVTQTCAASTGATPDCAPKFPVEAFVPGWSTPETIRWDWNPIGAANDFREYKLVIAGTEPEAASGAGQAKVFDSTVNAELGFYETPHEGDPRVLTYTITDGLDAFDPTIAGKGRYYARLEAWDIFGCPFSTAVVQGATQLAPVSEVSIFGEATSGWVLPTSLGVEPGCGPDGSACLRCSLSDLGAGACLVDGDWDNLVLGQSIDLSAITKNAFVAGQAYLELSIAVVSATPVYYAELELTGLSPGTPIDDCTALGTPFSVNAFHLRASSSRAYQKVQIPLNAMKTPDGQSLTYDDTSALTFCKLRIGADFQDATDVYVDSIAVRW